MSKSRISQKSGSKSNKQNIILTLYEKVDYDMLSKLISAEKIPEDIRKQLKMYSKKKDGKYIPVNYTFSKDIEEKGRLYAKNSLSLQSFKREIRHSLSRDYYHDIDMKNAHPNLISQYCHKHAIECKFLDKYVNNRDRLLLKIQKYHDINREDAKDLVLRLCYLGAYKINEIEPNNKINFLIEFRKELEMVAKEVCQIEKEIYELVKNNKDKLNKKSSTLSIKAQILEHKCLMAMYDFFIDKGFKVGVLCFDGLMIEKSDDDFNKLLKECEEYVKNKTGYEIFLDIKPMDIQLSFNLPQESNYVTSDLDCQIQLFNIEGKDTFKYCNGILYVFNETNGLFETRKETLFYYLIKNKDKLKIITQIGKDNSKEESYGEQNVLMQRVIPFVKTAAKDNEWIDKTQNSSIGYLLFKNGIYNMKEGKFSKGFDKNIVFHARIPWDYKDKDQNKINKAYDLSFGQLFDNPEHMIAAISRAISGDVKLKKFYFCPGKTNSGKSTFIEMLEIAFGNYIGNFNGESFAHTSSKDSKDPAALLRWALLTRFCRILLSSEINMKKELDGNSIKKHSSGGDTLIGRTHSGEETRFKPHYTCFGMFNDIPKITPMDQAIQGRLEYIEFPHVFTDEDNKKEKYYRKMNSDLKDIIQTEDFVQGFIHIILEGYKEYSVKMPIFDKDIKDRWTEDNKQSVEIIDLIKERYEITEDEKDTITIAEIKRFKESHKSLKTISLHNFYDILRDQLNLKDDRNKNGRYWSGLKLKID